MINLFLLLTGIVLGAILTITLIWIHAKIELDRKITKVNSIYTDIYNNLKLGKISCIRELNSLIQIDTISDEFGDITLGLFKETNLIAIFIGNECQLTSEHLTDNFKSLISIEIRKITVSNSAIINNPLYQAFIEVPKNKKDKEIDESLSLDLILDKINLVGYDKLTEVEKNFLKNYG